MCIQKNTYSTGFSLIELSIVLTVIGMLTGTVLAGKEIIHNSEMRKVIAKAEEFHAALRTFEDSYNYLPGDLPDANEYWANCVDYTGNNCAGDGDGLILDSGETSTGTEEKTRAWQHLSLAKIIEGEYVGSKSAPFLDTELPEGPMGGYYWIGHMTTHFSFQRNRYLSIEFGARSTDAVPNGAVISPKDAYNVDVKMDDGLASKGKVLSLNPGGRSDYGNCVDDNAYASEANYIDITNTDEECRMFFLD